MNLAKATHALSVDLYKVAKLRFNRTYRRYDRDELQQLLFRVSTRSLLFFISYQYVYVYVWVRLSYREKQQ